MRQIAFDKDGTVRITTTNGYDNLNRLTRNSEADFIMNRRPSGFERLLFMNYFRYVVLAIIVGLLAPVSQAIPQGAPGEVAQNSGRGPSEVMLLAADCVAYTPREQSNLGKSIRGRALACLALPHAALSELESVKEQLPGIEVAKQQVANANLLLIESENCDRAYARLHSIPQTAESTYSNFVSEIHQIARLALVTNLLAGDAIKIGLDLAAEGNPIVSVRLSTKWSHAACQ